MRRNIPDSFGEKVHAEFCKINIQNRAKLVAYNRALGLKDEKSFLNHASYNGAIRVPADFPDYLTPFIDKKTGPRFCDPGNWVYLIVFKKAWPNVTWTSNKGTVGDLLEAILGLAWIKNDRGETLSPEAEDFINMVEQACLSEYALGVYYPNQE